MGLLLVLRVQCVSLGRESVCGAVISSAYVVSCTKSGGSGMSEV